MKLYWFPPAPNAARAGFYLTEKGLDVERVLVDFTRGEQRAPEHLARNPAGTVPVLELDDGTCLTESLAEDLQVSRPCHTRVLRNLTEVGRDLERTVLVTDHRDGNTGNRLTEIDHRRR